MKFAEATLATSLALLFSAITSAAPLASTPIPIRLLTHNIRYAATSLFTNEKPWSTRRPKLVNELRFNAQNPSESFICMQEVLHAQLIDIYTDLNAGNTTSEWTYIGVGRDDGKQGGEYSPLFYRPATWDLLDFRTVWLSPTPDVPSFGWGAGSIRILTIGVFKHKATAQKVVGMCTHLDNVSSQSRLNSAKIIIDRINNYTGITSGSTSPLPVFLGGDFNSKTTEEAYLEMSKDYSPVSDLRLSIPEAQRYGNTNTFTDFTDSTGDDTLIDFLWVGPKNHTFWNVKTYAVLANKFDDGVYNSDHRAVAGDVILKV